MLSNDPFLHYFTTMFRVRVGRLREEKDRGAMSIEAAILVGVLVALAIGLGVFLTNKLTSKENAIN